VYRLVIVELAPGDRAQASSSYQAFAPGETTPFAFAACLWGDEGGVRAEADGRAAVAGHAAGAAHELEVVHERRAVAAVGAAALAALRALTDELEALQAAARSAYPDEVSCKRGCDACCHQRVGISRVEAARVAAAVAALDDAARAALFASIARVAARPADRPRCGALDDDGGCQIYGERPVVCRSHGLVYVMRRRPGALPVRQRSCSLNYNGRLPTGAEMYDTGSWGDRLQAIDDAYADDIGLDAELGAGRSIALAEVLARLAGG
jgi:Fe-S-cluster containining protein